MEPVKILLDTNLVIDLLTDRMGDGLARKVVEVGRDPRFELCISVLAAVNILYVTKKILPELKPSDLSDTFRILSMDAKQWKDAQDFEMGDFEDALQASCALNNGCIFAVSRDKHFGAAPMVTFTPAEFLKAVTE